MKEVKGYVFVKDMGRFGQRSPYLYPVIFGDAPLCKDYPKESLWAPFKNTLLPFSNDLGEGELLRIYGKFRQSEGNNHSLGRLEMQIQTNEDYDFVSFQNEDSFVLIVEDYPGKEQYGLLGKPKDKGVLLQFIPFLEGVIFGSYGEAFPFYLDARKKYGRRVSLSTLKFERINPLTFEVDRFRI